jgi:hypothetical protein
MCSDKLRRRSQQLLLVDRSNINASVEMFPTRFKEVTLNMGLLRIHRKAAEIEVMNHLLCSPTGNDDIVTIDKYTVYTAGSRHETEINDRARKRPEDDRFKIETERVAHGSELFSSNPLSINQSFLAAERV